jgi:hypothetical protein
MFVKISAILLSLGFSLTAMAGIEAKSAKRDPNISYKAYMVRAYMLAQQEHLETLAKAAVDSGMSADNAAKMPVAAWSTADELKEHFEFVRDLRFLESPQQPGFKRRSSWLFPDDGCFARAALAVKNLASRNDLPPNKIFVFGNLNVKTNNSPDGSVSWWYHVAPIIEVQGEKYVLDPALEPKHPLRMMDWLKLMGDPKQMQVAICGSGTYTPNDSCDKTTDGLEKSAGDDQIYYLDAEWDRLLELNRDPHKELGDLPPWM